MANWRARVTLPASLDKKIRGYAIANKKTLKIVVQEMIDDGIAAMRKDEMTYQFTYPAVLAASGGGETFEYVLDDSYRLEVETVTALLNGRGRMGRALAEALLVGAAKRGL